MKNKTISNLLLIGSFTLVIGGVLLFLNNYITVSHFILVGAVVAYIAYLWSLGSWEKIKKVITRKALGNAIAFLILAAIVLYNNVNPQPLEYIIGLIGVAYLILFFVLKFWKKDNPPTTI